MSGAACVSSDCPAGGARNVAPGTISANRRSALSNTVVHDVPGNAAMSGTTCRPGGRDAGARNASWLKNTRQMATGRLGVVFSSLLAVVDGTGVAAAAGILEASVATAAGMEREQRACTTGERSSSAVRPAVANVVICNKTVAKMVI